MSSPYDPYAPLRSLADGWDEYARQLRRRAEHGLALRRRILAGEDVPGLSERPVEQRAEELLTSALGNREVAAVYELCARQARSSIDLAGRHLVERIDLVTQEAAEGVTG